jgi:hypothetical protein
MNFKTVLSNEHRRAYGRIAGRFPPDATIRKLISNHFAFDYTTDSTRVSFLSPAALTCGNPVTETFVMHEQCYFKTPDPLFFVPDELQQPTQDFAGRLDNTNHFEALEYRNALTLDLTGPKQQLNTWPVELVSFSDMPETFLQQRLALGPAKLCADDQHQTRRGLYRTISTDSVGRHAARSRLKPPALLDQKTLASI